VINIAEGVRSVQRFSERSWNLYRLGRERNRAADAIGSSLRSALRGSLTREERGWINRVEQCALR
jgi:hypothetical protein